MATHELPDLLVQHKDFARHGPPGLQFRDGPAWQGLQRLEALGAADRARGAVDLGGPGLEMVKEMDVLPGVSKRVPKALQRTEMCPANHSHVQKSLNFNVLFTAQGAKGCLKQFQKSRRQPCTTWQQGTAMRDRLIARSDLSRATKYHCQGILRSKANAA